MIPPSPPETNLVAVCGVRFPSWEGLGVGKTSAEARSPSNSPLVRGRTGSEVPLLKGDLGGSS